MCKLDWGENVRDFSLYSNYINIICNSYKQYVICANMACMNIYDTTNTCHKSPCIYDVEIDKTTEN